MGTRQTEKETEMEKQASELTRADMVPATGKTKRGTYRGALVTRGPGHPSGREIGGVFKIADNQFKVYRIRDFSNGDIELALPGTYQAKNFEKAGTLRQSVSRTKQYWQFKDGVVIKEGLDS